MRTSSEKILENKEQTKLIIDERWEKAVRYQSSQEKPVVNILALMDGMAQIGDVHAKTKDLYKNDLKSFIIKWAVEAQYLRYPDQKKYNQIATEFALKKLYSLGEQNGYTERVKQEREFVKNLLPIPYVILGAVFLSLSIVFGFKFYLGFNGGSFLIGPWANLMLLIGAVGLTITVIVACIEWRRQIQHGPVPKEKKRK